MREKLTDYILSEWNKVQKEMAWGHPVVAGAAQKNHVLLYALERAGFKGLWGYRWEESGEDYGCPFGFFYPSTDRHNLGGDPASRIVGIPYASIVPRVLMNQAVRSGGEPSNNTHDNSQTAHREDDVADLRGQILKGIAHRTFDHYVANAKWNRWLAYVQQIDAMDLTALTSEHLEQLDAYLMYVCQQPETQVMLLSDALHDYRLGCPQTQPTFLLIDPPPEARAKSSPSMLCYYDAACQLTFEADKMSPIDMKNYVSPPVKSRYGVEFSLPQIEKFRPSRERNHLRMQFELESTKAMPYGLAIWGNHTGLTLAKSNANTVIQVGERLLFVRSDLQAGKNDIEVVLTI
jgi:hypothetical protein